MHILKVIKRLKRIFKDMSKTIAELEKEIGTIKDEPNQKEIDKQQADMLKAAKDARDKK